MVIAIFGPTASGKSAVADEVAERMPSNSCPRTRCSCTAGSRFSPNQCGPTGAARRDLAPRPRVVGGEYAPLAHAAIDEILAAGRTPVVVGGTGHYLRAALSDLSLPPAPQPGERDRWSRFYDDEGADVAHAHLAELDPAAARVVHANDRRRVVRALELAGRLLARARA